jgi:N6-adenosine-specific RNA methylase IME4
MVDLSSLPRDHFATIMADPPWARSDGDAPVKPNTRKPGEESRFPTMKWHEIAAMPVESVAADRAHLWMWSLNTTMEQAYRIVRAWGFVPKGLVTWKKSGGLTGRRMYFWSRSEQLMFEWPRPGRWAKKPDGSYELIEHVSIGPRLELFARTQRDGWTTWGDEV